MWHFRVLGLCLAFIVVLVAGIITSLAPTAGTTIRIGGTGAAVGQISRLVEFFGVRRPGVVVDSLANLESGRHPLFNEQVVVLHQVRSSLVARSIAFNGAEPGIPSRTSRFSASLGI